ncbi:MAG: DUF86 domain-containing protein [Bacillota bacterium]|nr:DUF86 domain-containing protein [Bacillota bacterium]
MVNSSKVLQKLRIIKENLSKLTVLKNVSEEEFINDFQKFDAAKYNLQTTIEAMVDICNHIISRMDFELPRTNADSFRILCREKILNQDMEDSFLAMSRFRNRVVHMYVQVDNREIYQIIQVNLGDFTEFIKDITRFLDGNR